MSLKSICEKSLGDIVKKMPQLNMKNELVVTRIHVNGQSINILTNYINIIYYTYIIRLVQKCGKQIMSQYQEFETTSYKMFTDNMVKQQIYKN